MKERSISNQKSFNISPINSPPTKKEAHFMNLSLIGKSRAEKTTKMIIEERKEMEESQGKEPYKNPPTGVKSMVLQPINSIDHSLFLEARIRNLNESIEDLNTQIQQEKNGMDSIKVRRRRVKNLIMSMLTRLLRYPVEAL